ncbi:MAG: hypothetical protein MR914_03445 [Clostridiales bacterium]|nr:hypothetical protein [Clostridiales bacterium]
MRGRWARRAGRGARAQVAARALVAVRARWSRYVGTVHGVRTLGAARGYWAQHAGQRKRRTAP